MIVTCRNCAKRVRLDRERYAGKRIKLRCAQCGDEQFVDVAPLPKSDHPPEPAASHSILIAHSDPELCATVGSVLASANLAWKACQSGSEALATMDTAPPEIVIIDVALPGLFAFEVVETVRARPGLDKVKIILLSSVYNKMAYKRRPHSLYGADDYIEKHHIPTDLVDKIRHHAPHLFNRKAANLSHHHAKRAEIDLVKERLLQAEASEVAAAGNDRVAIEKAQRLARIIVSDIALYNEEKLAEGIRSNTFFDIFATEIAEGRRHFLERIPVDIPDRESILDQAFMTLLEHRRRDLANG